MSDRTKIKIRIAPDGTPTIKIEGIQGVSCKDVSKGIEKALGVTVEDKKTSEYYGQEGGENDQHHTHRA